MTTYWTSPTLLDQYPETGAETVHIPWNITFTKASTAGNLVHLARKPKTDYINKTFYLTATGFEFDTLPDSLSGIELVINADRKGRVTDETVQLILNNAPVGDNLASLDLSESKSYGGQSNLWGSTLTINDIVNPSFGIVMRFQSHPQYPHRDGINIRSVELVIH